jgi:hypothetical protein
MVRRNDGMERIAMLQQQARDNQRRCALRWHRQRVAPVARNGDSVRWRRGSDKKPTWMLPGGRGTAAERCHQTVSGRGWRAEARPDA